MTAVEAIGRSAHPLTGGARDYDALLEAIGNARVVLLGEGSHGTHEFYAERARITRRLIEEKGFTAVGAEADWPDAYRVNCFVRGVSADADAGAALGEFVRFPPWMWRNTVVLEFVDWLRGWNDDLPDGARRTGFYGLDLYSLGASMEAVIDYLDRVDPDAARRARARYACFEHADARGPEYGRAVALGETEPCEDDVVAQLVELHRRSAELASRDGRIPEDAWFFAQQNARVVLGAERYYRAMFRGRDESWNLRDRHMAETLGALRAHLGRDGAGPARIVVWAHNSHVGDARATEMARRAELNLGQLAREMYGDDVFTVGLTTATGTVTAARDWGGPGERRTVNEPLDGSWEALFHGTGLGNFLLLSGEAAEPASGTGHAGADLLEPRLERAIGVVYRPETERSSHYFEAELLRQFDAVVHIDETTAVEPLEREPSWGRRRHLSFPQATRG